MVTKISLIVALCANISMDKIHAKLTQLETQNPGSKVTLRIDKKLKCDSLGSPVKRETE